MADPIRGEIWLTDLGTGRGHEQAGQRPALVVSDDAFNSGFAGLVIVIPLTSRVLKSKYIPAHIRIDPPEAGLKTPSVILCDQLRTISKDRLVKALGEQCRPQPCRKWKRPCGCCWPYNGRALRH
jgi:mRNA interferase MazF